MGWITLTSVFCCMVLSILPISALAFHPIALMGLSIHLWRPDAQTESRPGMPAIVVRLPIHHGRPDLYVDSQPVSRQDFDSVLREKLTHYPPHWPIYLDGDPAMDWGEAVHVIDAIRGMGGEVILLSRQQRPAKVRDH